VGNVFQFNDDLGNPGFLDRQGLRGRRILRNHHLRYNEKS
jgi:hypothetical protein